MHPRKSGSQPTRRWREPDSNPRSPVAGRGQAARNQISRTTTGAEAYVRRNKAADRLLRRAPDSPSRNLPPPLLDRRGAQGGNPVEPGRFDVLGDRRLPPIGSLYTLGLGNSSALRRTDIKSPRPRGSTSTRRSRLEGPPKHAHEGADRSSLGQDMMRQARQASRLSGTRCRRARNPGRTRRTGRGLTSPGCRSVQQSAHYHDNLLNLKT